MNDDTYITEINTLEDAGKLFKLIQKDLADLDVKLDFVNGLAPDALCPKIYYGAGYATFKRDTLRRLMKATRYFADRIDEPETRNSFAVFYNETMPEGHRLGFFSILNWEVDEIMNMNIPVEIIGRTPRAKELYPKITIGKLKQHLLNTVRKYRQFEVELKKKEIKDAVLGYE